MKDYYISGTFSTYNVDCPHKHKCTSANSFKCWSCKHNKGKRDYYEPEPYNPYPKPWTPDPYKPIWVINCRSQTKTMKTPYFVD